jgi:hypothetical protein
MRILIVEELLMIQKRIVTPASAFAGVNSGGSPEGFTAAGFPLPRE